MTWLRTVFRQLVLWLALLVSVFPLVWILLTSVKVPRDIYGLPPVILPRRGLTLDHYIRIYQHAESLGHFVPYFENSVVVSTVTVALVCVVGGLAGYAFARIRFPLRRFFFLLFLLPFFLPQRWIGGSLYAAAKSMGLYDTRLFLILAYASGAGYLQGQIGIVGGIAGGVFSGISWAALIMRSFFLSVPPEIEDAAKIDGCTHLKIFRKIMLPLAWNGLILVAVMNFIGAWNEYGLSAILTLTDRARTLGIGAIQLMSSWQYLDHGIAAAVATLMFLPTTVMFLALQRRFMSGIAKGIFKL